MEPGKEIILQRAKDDCNDFIFGVQVNNLSLSKSMYRGIHTAMTDIHYGKDVAKVWEETVSQEYIDQYNKM